MAGAILSSIIKLATEKLSMVIGAAPSPAPIKSPTQFLCPGGEEKDQLAELKATMLWIQDVLDHAEEKDINDHSEKLRLRELQDLASDAEDVVGEYEYHLLRSKLEAQAQLEITVGHKRKSHHKVDSSFTHDYEMVSAASDLFGLAHRVREIRESFNEITREWQNLQLPEKVAKKRRLRAWKPPTTTSFVDKSSVFGRKDEKQKLVDFLLSEDNSANSANSAGAVSVLPIVGIGGIGKTTLAQLVYNDPTVRQHFNLTGWICVSQEFDVVSLVRNIVICFSGRDMEYMDLSKLQDALRATLQGKRFLLVLDDVWNDIPSLWEPVRMALLTAGIGTVLVTTRNFSVASVMQTRPPLELRGLSFDECWELFKKITFGGLNANVDAELLEIGKKIVEKCRGLPLAVKVLGGILRWESHEETWIIILESELWELEHEQDEILPALKLSYKHMPTHLKRCFMYLSLFPKDYNFDKDDLVKLWMSQGLLQPNEMSQGLLQPNETKEPEDIGDEYVNNLLQRSILQKNELEEKYLEMHDLIHDLAKSVAGDEYSVRRIQNSSDVLKNVRHLSVALSSKDEINSDLQCLRNSKPLRTLMSTRNNDKSSWWQVIFKIPGELFLNLKCIRALDLSYTGTEELPESIGNLIQLRYLCIKRTNIKTLPESVCNLYNLQTLDLDMEFQKLPMGIGKLFNLRHLMLPHPYVCMPAGVGKLTNLQTLLHFNVGRDGSHCGIGELKNLANLRGTLTINWLANASQLHVSHPEAYLKNKKGLVSLDLNWPAYSNRECLHRDDTETENEDKTHDQEGVGVQPSFAGERIAEQVLESLEPHTNIKELKLYSYTGSRFPRWLGDASFSNLASVYLSYCSKPSLLPPLGQLPSLRVLTIQAMPHVECINQEFFGSKCATMRFPSLESLTFFDLSQWVEWRGLQEGDFPRLNQLSLNRCPKLRQLPLCLLLSIKELAIEFCDGLSTLIFPTANTISSLMLQGKWNPEMLCSSHMPMLQNLQLSYSTETSFILPAHNLPSLKKISAFKCGLTSLVGLASLTTLESLHISNCFKIRFEQLPPTLHEVKMSTCNPEVEKWCQEQVLRIKNEV